MILTPIEIDLELGPFDVMAVNEHEGPFPVFTVSLVRCNCWGHGSRRNGPFEMLFCDEHRDFGQGSRTPSAANARAR